MYEATKKDNLKVKGIDNQIEQVNEEFEEILLTGDQLEVRDITLVLADLGGHRGQAARTVGQHRLQPGGDDIGLVPAPFDIDPQFRHGVELFQVLAIHAMHGQPLARGDDPDDPFPRQGMTAFADIVTGSFRL